MAMFSTATLHARDASGPGGRDGNGQGLCKGDVILLIRISRQLPGSSLRKILFRHPAICWAPLKRVHQLTEASLTPISKLPRNNTSRREGNS